MGKYFKELNSALAQFQATGPSLRTIEFTELVDCTLNAFDYLGMVMGFAKVEASGKCASLKEAAIKCPTLADIVSADKLAGTVRPATPQGQTRSSTKTVPRHHCRCTPLNHGARAQNPAVRTRS